MSAADRIARARAYREAYAGRWMGWNTPSPEVEMLNFPTTADELARASRAGIAIVVSEELDRVPADRRDPRVACPTCDDGIITITYPKRCRECTKEGL